MKQKQRRKKRKEREKEGTKIKQKERQEGKQKQKRNKEGLGPSEVALRNQKTTKKKQKKQIKKMKKNTKKNQKRAFQLSVKIFFFIWGGVQKFPFLTTWPRKRAPKKHYKNRSFSKAFLEKQLCVTKRPFLDKKNQIQKFQLSFYFGSFLLVQQQKTKTSAEPPIFLVFWQS